ncbi:type I-E CRISPR-associated protein Cse1/CasA [Streptomyces sp. NPDC054784]
MAFRGMNLLVEPWIPVRWLPNAASDETSHPDRVGLREVLLRSHEIAGLAVAEPPAHSAVLRVLYALTARVTGLDEKGPGDWGDRRLDDVLDAGHLDEGGVEAYFGRYADRFWLFDEEGGRPWMQDVRLAEQCDGGNTAGVNKLVVTRPAGNNHSWFRHTRDAEPDLPTAADAALNLLVWHYYGASGRCSSREVNGVKSASASAGPLRTALSYHPEGASLFETLLAGLVPPDVTVKRGEDRCPWEWETLPDPVKTPPEPVGPCSRLTACSQHALLLVPDAADPGKVRDAYITWAYAGGRIPRSDPYLIWQISQQGNPYPRPADSGRALWRDLDALLLKEADGSAQPRQPEVFRTAHEVSEELRVRALGFEQDGQAKDLQFVDASTPPVVDVVQAEVARSEHAVGVLRQFGERYGRGVTRAVNRAWALYTGDRKAVNDAWAAEVAGHYWPRAEREFWRLFGQLERAPGALDVGLDRTEARAAFVALAKAAYEHVTDTIARTNKGAKAVAAARKEIYGASRR